MADRIEVLDRLERYIELDGVPITGPFGEPVIVEDSRGYTLKTAARPVHGRVYDLTIPPRYDIGARLRQGAPQSERLLFRGLKREVVVSLGTQKFEAIVSYKCRPGAEEVHHWMNGGGSGSLQLGSAGMVTGFISDPDWDRRSGRENEAR